MVTDACRLLLINLIGNDLLTSKELMCVDSNIYLLVRSGRTWLRRWHGNEFKYFWVQRLFSFF